jgi:hypothetical protein
MSNLFLLNIKDRKQKQRAKETDKVKWNKINKTNTHIPLDTCEDVSHYRVQEKFKTDSTSGIL